MSFSMYFILTARNAILSGGYELPHHISVSIYLVGCEQALLGVGVGRGKGDPPPRELARRLSIWGNWRCWRLSLLIDCRLYAPHSQIWPEYELETASCSSYFALGPPVYAYNYTLFSRTMESLHANSLGSDRGYQRGQFWLISQTISSRIWTLVGLQMLISGPI